MLPEAGNPYRDGRASYGETTVGATTALIGIAVTDRPQPVRTGGPEAVVARPGPVGGYELPTGSPACWRAIRRSCGWLAAASASRSPMSPFLYRLKRLWSNVCMP